MFSWGYASTLLTWYVWGGDAVIAEYTSASWGGAYTWAKNYVYAGSRLLSTFTNNGSGGEALEFHHPDRLGTRMVTNPSADTLYLQSTLPFGTLLSSETTGSSNRLFTTYDRNTATGLDYAVNRTYSSAQGRFTQPDPIGMASVSIADPQSFNLYAYVQNRPTDATDPSGLDDEPDWTDICFSAEYGGCGVGQDMTNFAIEFSLRQTFGFSYYDLPGNSNETERALERYGSIISTGFDPEFNVYWGTVTITRTDSDGQTSAQTLTNPTPVEVTTAYLKAAGLYQYILGDITSTGRRDGGVTFQFDPKFETEILAILNNTKIFHSGPFGGLHKKAVGGGPVKDYRSITGDPANGYLGSRSLQVVINRKTLFSYADTDRFNPYQDVRGAIGHLFLEVIPNLVRKIF